MVIAWLALLLKGALFTITVALGAITLGFLGGLAIGIGSSKKIRNRWLGPLLDMYVLVVRGTPQYVQLLIVYYVLPELLGINMSPLTAGILALGLNEAAYCGEIVRGGFNALPTGQWEACRALGYSRWVTVKDIALPQMIRATFPSLANEIVTIIKDTSIVSVIGLIEITQIGKNLVAITLKPIQVYALVALTYLIITSSITMLAKFIERKLRYD